MGEYRSLTAPANESSDLIQLAVAQTVRGQPMLGIVELRRTSAGNRFTSSTTICPGSCSQKPGIFYFGYWERIKPYVAGSGRTRSVASAASLDRLIRLEIGAHPGEVSGPINILELTGSGARWLQNGGNCSLPECRLVGQRRGQPQPSLNLSTITIWLILKCSLVELDADY